MVGTLAGEDLSSFRAGMRAHLVESQALNYRKLWQHAVRLDQLDAETRATLDPEHGWFVFAVVRDPRARLFSAWQSKLLLQHPAYTKYRSEDWYPRIPADSQGVIDDFRTFVSMLDSAPDHPLLTGDVHFRTQTELTYLDRVSYSRIYDIGEIPQLRDDVAAHIAALGFSEAVTIPRSNETPLAAVPAVFAAPTGSAIERLYAADFEAFGKSWDLTALDGATPWTQSSIDQVRIRAELGERMGNLRDLAVKARRSSKKAKQKVKHLERELEQTKGQRPLARGHGGPSPDSSSPHRLRTLRGAVSQFRRLIAGLVRRG